MQKLIINTNDAFRPAVGKCISKDDMFYEQYKRALEILKEILDTKAYEDNENSLNSEYKNNIIAFCGERGDGKTSAMLTFSNAICNEGFKVENEDVLKEKFAAKPIVIDPSMFDDVHNIIDIVLANLYQKFTDWCEKGDCNYKNKDVMYKKNELEELFDKVYRCVSLIANPEKMKECEYDYDGNIGKISRLGESTKLKDNLKELIERYLEFETLIEKDKNSNSNNKNLIIAIDDLDLSNGNAYKMAEQIRKYLIIPNVVIIMAIKIDQLEMGVIENNLAYYSNIGKNGEYYNIKEKAAIMAEKYISKLIPSVHRIYMPKMGNVNEITVVSNDSKENTQNINNQVMELIREKTGMIFITKDKGKNIIIPESLREFVNLWHMLNALESTKEDVKKEIYNTEKFREYIKNNYISKFPIEIKNEINEIDFEYDNDICYKASMFVCNNMKKNNISITEVSAWKSIGRVVKGIVKGQSDERIENEFSNVISWLETADEGIYGEKIRNYIYVLKIMITCKLNIFRLRTILLKQKYEEKNNEEKNIYINELMLNVKSNAEFAGYNLWGKNAEDILPSVSETNVKRARFELPFSLFKDTIKDVLNIKYINIDEDNIAENASIRVRDFDIKSDKDSLKYWIVLGLVSYGKFSGESDGSGYIIADNRNVNKDFYVALDSFIVGLSNLYSLYYKVNFNVMGIDEKDFYDAVSEYEEYNKDLIKYAKYIAYNADCILELKKYCYENRNVKDKIVGLSTTDSLVKKFFANIVDFLKEKLGLDIVDDKKEEIFRYFYFTKDHSDKIDIVELYSKLIGCKSRQMSMKEAFAKSNEDYFKGNFVLSDRDFDMLKDGPFDQPVNFYEHDFRGVASYVKMIDNIEKNIIGMVYNMQFINCCVQMTNLEQVEVNKIRKLYYDINKYNRTKIGDEEILIGDYKAIADIYNNKYYNQYIRGKNKSDYKK